MFMFTNHMDPVKGYLGRYLRRRLIHCECLTGVRQPAEFLRIIEFLSKVWTVLNTVIFYL
jgi:neuron navigator 2